MSIISPVPTDTNGNPRNTGAMKELGRDDFLKLLVAKLEYQDPLNPMQDEDFVAQLAQFSSLEQMHNISEGIQSSNEWDFMQMQSINNTMAAGLIGHDVKAAYDGVYVDESTKPTISFTSPEFAASMSFSILDNDGNVVRTLRMETVPAGVGSITWDGKDEFGNSVEPGNYQVRVTAVGTSGAVFEPKLSLIGRVESITYRDGTAFLKVNGVELALGDIVAIGEPGAFTE